MRDTQIKGTPDIIQNDNLQENVGNPKEKETITLESGKTALTLSPGKLYPLSFMEILAGDVIESYNVDTITRILTPFVPTFDKVLIKLSAYFVPHTRVWKSAEKAIAGKASLQNGISAMSNLPIHIQVNSYTKYNEFRDTLVARYGYPNNSQTQNINPLLMRGYRAIFNDFIINKEYENPLTEWNDDTLVVAEENALLAYNATTGAPLSGAYYIEACQTTKNYLTNVKRQINATADTMAAGLATAEHLDWQTRFMNSKQRITNANKNDWDIIADMGGTQPVRTDRVEFLGEITYPMNYQQITQSAPEIDGSAPLGTTGAFSYTRATGDLFNYKEFKQHGFVHIMVEIQIEKNYESSLPKELLKSKVDDIYRPANSKKEIQLLYAAEVSNHEQSVTNATVAFQPPFAEYKRLPRIVTGEMRTTPLVKRATAPVNQPPYISHSHWHNFIQHAAIAPTITLDYFRNYIEVLKVMARNNTLTYNLEDAGYVNDMIMQMAEINVRMKRPISTNTKTKADQTR